MSHSKQDTPGQVLAFCEGFQNLPQQRPLIAMPISYSSINESVLSAAGVKIIIYANQLLCTAFPSMMMTATSILEHGHAKQNQGRVSPIKEILDFVTLK